ncbi:MAG: hypothetical protein K8S98_06355 [Planctomycetes bacterium]|nr:hypothetical protein [Planctomycetota bacterium]
MAGKVWLGLAAAVVASCGGSSSSGSDGASPGASTSTFVDGFSLVASKAIAVDANGEVFAGAGGEVLMLRHSLPPAVEPLTLANPATITTRGFVRDLALTPDYVYAATWKNGLVVARRSDGSLVHTEPLIGTEGARCVAVLDGDGATCPGKRIVVVGTHEPHGSATPPAPSDGRVLILEHDLATDALVVRAVFDAGAMVECLAASSAIAPPPSGANTASFSVLLGADCATVGGARAYLQRRDYSYRCDSGALEITEDSVTPWPGALPEPERILRDIVIDESAGRAYVAAYFHGVLAFDVSPGNLVEDTSPGWPLQVEDGLGHARLGFANAVALDPAPEAIAGKGARLFVGWGPDFAGEWQFFGDSSRVECAAPPAPLVAPQVSGVRAYRLDTAEDPEVGANGANPELVIDPAPTLDFGISDLAVRHVSPSTYYVYAALDAGGVAVARADEVAGTWGANIEAQWDQHDPGKLPLAAHDDVLVLTHPGVGDFLYVSTELGVATFDLRQPKALGDATCVNSSAQAMPVPCTEPGGGVTLAGVPNPNGRIFAATVNGATTNPGGLRVYDVSTPDAPLALGPELDKGGRGFSVCVVKGAYSGPKPADADRGRWVLTSQSQSATPSASFSVKLWDFGSQNDPHDPGCVGACTPPQLLATWTDSNSTDFLEGVAAQEVAGGTELAIYVPYCVNGDSASSIASARAGLVVLRAKLDSLNKVQVTKVQKTIEFTGVDALFKAGRITFDADARRVYVAWGTGGIAVYDVASPYAAKSAAKRDFSKDFGVYHQRLSPTQVLRGPSQCGFDFLYVSFVNDGIGVFDANSDLSGPITFLPVLGQTISLTVDPADPTRGTVFVAEGRGGVEKLRIDVCGN